MSRFPWQLTQEPFTIATAHALHMRLSLGYSDFTDEGHERPIPRRRDRRGELLPRRPPRETNWIPSPEELLRLFTAPVRQ